MAASPGYIRFIARSTRVSIILVLVVLVAITIINWNAGISAAPFWFYLAIVAMSGAVWLFTTWLLSLANRRN